MKKILLIEDNTDIRENTAELLELASYKVIEAENGRVGVEKALENKPDLIICDIMMPELDGYGVLHAVQQNESVRNTPFIFLSAKAERTDMRKGMQLGADDYLTKPFDATDLLNAVASRLQKMEKLKEEMGPGINGLRNLMETVSASHALKELTEGRYTNKYKKKQLIYLEGNHPNRLYYIVSGKVKSFKTNEDGKDFITNLYSPGDFLGYIALLEGSTYKDTAEALEESEIAVIPREDFDQLIGMNAEVARKFIQILAKNLSEKENMLLGLAYNSLRKKVANAILLVSRKYNSDKKNNFSIDISRENLSVIAGTATESLIRTLADFRSEKLIEIQDGKILILNQTKLETLAN